MKTNGNRQDEEKIDLRPDPKPRKLAHLWQAYLQFTSLRRLRIQSDNRTSSIQKGKSVMDYELETLFQEALNMDKVEAMLLKTMKNFGNSVGPAWDWVNGIKGMGESTSAQLFALIDDIGKFDTVSKLWRYAGMAVIEGEAERTTRGEKSHFNRDLKTLLLGVVADNFVKQQTPIYIDIYYAEKERQRRLHPEPEQASGKKLWSKDYTPMHIDRMARRKMMKIFLQHLWLKWREFEGLPVSDPYAHAILGHSHKIDP